MKKSLLLLLTAFIALATSAEAQEKKVVMTAQDVEITAGEQADLVISMNYTTEVPVCGWNIYLALPEGVDLYFDEEEEDYIYSVSTNFITKKLSKWFGIKTIAGLERTYLLYYIDQDNMTPMKTTEGELLTITLAATEQASEQCFGTLYDIALTDQANNSLDLGNIADSEFNITVKGGISTGIHGIGTSDDDAPVYNLGGQRVKDPAKGIFVKNGIKVVKK